MKSKKVPVAIAAIAVAASAEAALVGMDVVGSSVTVGPNTFHVFRLFARFDNANDTVLNVFGMNALPAGAFWHDDFLSGPGGSNLLGTWSPSQVSPGTASVDSWVTIGGTAGDFGNLTAAEPGWGPNGFLQAGIPAGAGWYNPFPPNLQGRVNPGTLQTLVAQFVFRNTITTFTTSISVGFNQGIGTPGQVEVSSFTVPAPGAVALLGLAGLAGRRRRA